MNDPERGEDVCVWLDVSAGVSGDMLVGALIDAGASLEVVQSAVDAVIPQTVRLVAHDTVRAGMRALKVDVELLAADQHHRHWSEIRDRLREADLAEVVRESAHAVFERLAVAEARVHGTSIDDVHFHEVGAWDSIADVVGTCAALADLGVLVAGGGEVEVPRTHVPPPVDVASAVDLGPAADVAAGGARPHRVTASRISLGSGSVRAAHGRVPVPVPAVLELCRGWDVTSGGDGELATPTGVALVTAIAAEQSPMPAMTVRSVGIGAGTKEQPDRANVVRVVVGQPVGVQGAGTAPGADGVTARVTSSVADTAWGAGAGAGMSERLQVLEANVDDLDPRLWPTVIDGLLDAGAADAWTTPITMKRGRPAQLLSVLAAPSLVATLIDVVFASTSTIGVRARDVTRWALDRGWADVEVSGQRVGIKVAHRAGRIVNAAAEFRDVEAAAATLDLPVREVLDAAEAAGAAAGLARGNGIPEGLRATP
ncbi:MAG TPA: LarC family nickel insertion protein [Humibacillus xanthopallidus]|nr:LarC family nickel insertion protein [Humibacillus xanthopallidus]